MLSKSLSYYINPLHFKHHLSISSPSSAIILKAAENVLQQGDPSHKNNSLPFVRLKEYVGCVNESHLSSSFISNTLKISAKKGFLSQGKQLHSHLIKLGYHRQQSLHNQLLNLYVKCREVSDACKVFDEMLERNVVSWNIIISGSVGYGRNPETMVGENMIKGMDLYDFSSENLALFFFKKMLVEMVEPNYITFISVLGACVGLNDIEIGKQVHCFIIKSRYNSNGFVGSALVDLYGKCRLVEDARRVFNKIRWRDLVCWNVMVSCYVLNALAREALEVFALMSNEGVMGDDFTFSSLVNSCSIVGACKLGTQIHGLIVRLSLDLDVFVASALVDMYAKNRNMESARKAFDWMTIRNAVSWTSIIVGYGQNGEGKEAMRLYRQMLRGDLKPDELTLASILSSCANLAAINEALQVHTHVAKNGFEAFLSINNALISAYSKSGSILRAFQSFSLIAEPDIVTWTSMIGAYAFHGLAKQAIEIFKKMLHEGVRPDRVAFVGVLSACSHAGLVSEGIHYFRSMMKDHQIFPDSEHYTCLVDLLGRAGHVDEAYEILVNMPFEPGGNVLGAFISACKVHGNLGLAKWAAEKLFKLEPDKPVNYTLVSNIYASEGSWSDVASVRKMMRNNCDSKVPGCSWTEIGGKVHTFVSNDKSHPQVLEIFIMLEMLYWLMKEDGCKHAL